MKFLNLFEKWGNAKIKLIFPNFYEYVILENVLKNFIIFYWYLIISGSGLMTHFINIYADRICLATIIKKKSFVPHTLFNKN